MSQQSSNGAPPQWSQDREWWWDGEKWMPAAQALAPVDSASASQQGTELDSAPGEHERSELPIDQHDLIIGDSRWDGQMWVPVAAHGGLEIATAGGEVTPRPSSVEPRFSDDRQW